MRIWKWAGTAALAAIATGAAAGPPYITDDPEPTDLGHWEIYGFAGGAKSGGSFEGAVGLDLNYGAFEDVQLTATLPVGFTDEGRGHAGAGDLEIGVKYRFFEDEKAGVAVAVFPRIILPTAGRRFGTGRVQLLLPIWAQKEFGPWSLFGGGGYTINPGAGNRNFWQGGLALTRTVSPRLSLGGEIAFEQSDAVGGRSSAALGVGGSYRLHGPFSLLFSGGPGIAHRRDGERYHLYVALAANF
jgi:hypothetical protein